MAYKAIYEVPNTGARFFFDNISGLTPGSMFTKSSIIVGYDHQAETAIGHFLIYQPLVHPYNGFKILKSGIALSTIPLTGSEGPCAISIGVSKLITTPTNNFEAYDQYLDSNKLNWIVPARYSNTRRDLNTPSLNSLLNEIMEVGVENKTWELEDSLIVFLVPINYSKFETVYYEFHSANVNFLTSYESRLSIDYVYTLDEHVIEHVLYIDGKFTIERGAIYTITDLPISIAFGLTLINNNTNDDSLILDTEFIISYLNHTIQEDLFIYFDFLLENKYNLTLNEELFFETYFNQGRFNQELPISGEFSLTRSYPLSLEETFTFDTDFISNRQNIELEDLFIINSSFELMTPGLIINDSLADFVVNYTFNLTKINTFILESSLTLESNTLGYGHKSGNELPTIVLNTGYDNEGYNQEDSNTTGPIPCKSPLDDNMAVKDFQFNILNDFEISFNATTVTILAPLFNNIEQKEHKRILRHSRGGNLIVYTDVFWKSSKILKLQFDGLTISVLNELYTLINDSLGKIITIRTHENVTYSGFVINPLIESQELKEDCDHTFELEIEIIDQANQSFDDSFTDSWG